MSSNPDRLELMQELGIQSEQVADLIIGARKARRDHGRSENGSAG